MGSNISFGLAPEGTPIEIPRSQSPLIPPNISFGQADLSKASTFTGNPNPQNPGYSKITPAQGSQFQEFMKNLQARGEDKAFFQAQRAKDALARGGNVPIPMGGPTNVAPYNYTGEAIPLESAGGPLGQKAPGPTIEGTSNGTAVSPKTYTGQAIPPESVGGSVGAKGAGPTIEGNLASKAEEFLAKRGLSSLTEGLLSALGLGGKAAVGGAAGAIPLVMSPSSTQTDEQEKALLAQANDPKMAAARAAMAPNKNSPALQFTDFDKPQTQPQPQTRFNQPNDRYDSAENVKAAPAKAPSPSEQKLVNTLGRGVKPKAPVAKKPTTEDLNAKFAKAYAEDPNFSSLSITEQMKKLGLM